MEDQRPVGRPSLYSPELAKIICAEIAEGKSVREICRMDDMPAASTVFLWVIKHQDFSEQYAKAISARSDHWAEEILEIADDGSNDWMERHHGEETIWITNGEALNRSRLRVDTRKWLLSKLQPKKYGERIATEVSGPDGGPIQTQDISATESARRIAFLLSAATQETP